MNWQFVSGIDLERTFVGDDRMTENVPNQSAVYAWKRRFYPPLGLESDPTALAEWIAHTAQTPSAVLPARELSHYLHLDGISIGGAALTDAKLKTLREWTKEVASRRWLLSMVKNIGRLVPPLYIGETDNLARRVTDHLGDKTDFSKILREKLHLTWQDCELWFYLLPGELLAINAKERRTLVELIVARLTIAGCTSRPG